MITALARLFAAGFGLLLLAGVALGYGVWVFQKPGPLTRDTLVIVPRGMGVNAIAQMLEAEGVVADEYVFLAGTLAMNADRGLRAGEYRFPAGISARGAMEILRDGRAVVHSVTIPEGLTVREVVDILRTDERLTQDLPDDLPAEGSILPETYAFNRTDSAAALLARMQAEQDAVLETLWPNRAPDLPLDSPEEAVILASIVEKETGVGGERPKVASVFFNRLNRGMRLQSDPTVIYAITEGRAPLGRPLYRSDWEYESPYNTYRVAGLPPGPIANPGRAAIEAVLNPSETDYLYFVADGTGGHAFARTLDEHNRNVRAWRRIRDGG